MTNTIRWKGCNKNDSIASYIDEKIEKFSKFHFVMPNVKTEVVFYPKQQSYTVRMNVSVKTKGLLRAEGSGNEITTAINFCVDKIIDQLRRVKTQFKDN